MYTDFEKFTQTWFAGFVFCPGLRTPKFSACTALGPMVQQQKVLDMNKMSRGELVGGGTITS